MEAHNDVLIVYDGALILSDRAVYDKNTSRLILDGHVEMLGRDEKRVASEHLVINTETKEVQFKDFFITAEENIWMEASNASRNNDHYKIFDSKLSSCNKTNPDWTIEFSKAHYHKDENFISMRDAKLRFFDTTIFYFPYFAFSTVNERTSGLLFPVLRLSTVEGFMYAQPYFYVPSNNVDVEFTPQIRTERGYGAHITTRFVDSNHSSGHFTTGYFKNKKAYSDKYNFNNEHYGFEFLYKSTNALPEFLKWDGAKSGFFANGTYLNDLEYLNLQQSTASSLVSSNLIESRVNAFVYDESNYVGLYGKYYIDTFKKSNAKTLQELPTLQYHRFLEKVPKNHLLYTFDAKVHNYSRRTGSRAYQTEFDLPITYYDSFFNDYLDFSLSENLYLTDVSFSNLGYQSKDYRFYRNYHTMEFSSDLSKQYGSAVHTLHPSIIYTKPSFEKESPLNYHNLNTNQKELFVTQTQQEQLSLGLSQYYYNPDLEMNLFHRFALSKFPKDPTSKGDFNNEFGYTGESWTLYSNLFYSLDKEKINSLTNTIGYNQSNYDIILTHFYNNDFLDKTKKTSFMNGTLRHNYNQHNQWFANYDYDLEQEFNHQWHIGWIHRQKCWGAQISIGQERIPNFDTSFRNTIAYFELTLNPFGGIARSVEQEFSPKGR